MGISAAKVVLQMNLKILLKIVCSHFHSVSTEYGLEHSRSSFSPPHDDDAVAESVQFGYSLSYLS